MSATATFWANECPVEGTPIGTEVITVAVGERDPRVYDGNGDGVIQKGEALRAVQDYFGGEITKMQVLQLLQLYFG